MSTPLIGLSPDLYARFQQHICQCPTPGFGYLVGQNDILSNLLMQAYGPQGGAYQQAFMGFNNQIPQAAFGNLSSIAGQLMYFPLLAQLQQMQAAQAAAMMPPGFSGMDALMAQAGFQSPAAQFFGGMPGGVPAANPELAALLVSAMMSGRMPTQIGPNGIVDQNGTQLSWNDILSGAREAVREGRTSQGGRGTRPTQDRVDRAVNESWTPRPGTPSRNGVVPMSQLDYNDQLGNGGRTIRQAGCYMTAMTMAATSITGDTSLNPRIANDRIRRGGGFSGSSLVVDNAARSLGMRCTGRTAVNAGNAQQSLRRLDESLAAGRPVVAGVDYKAGSSSARSSADHFITITGRNADGSYTAVDPAGGREITLRPDANGVLRGGSKGYTVTELTFLERR